MRKESLGFQHKNILYGRFKQISASLSEYSFSNLYLFRNTHSYEVVFDEEVFIKGKTYDGFHYLMPTTDIKRTEHGYLKAVMKDADFLFPVPEEWLEIFDPREFEYSYNEGDTDYIYTVEKISEFKGRRLHKKRNLLKQFLRLYKPDSFALTKDRMEDAVHILHGWQGDIEISAEETDFYPCLEALKMYDELVLCGGIYYAEGEPGGFILGEELNEETFAIHFAKGRKKFKGLYQYMYSSFAKILPKKYKYLNFEQDLGRLALRIAKSSYLPDNMLRKFRVKAR